MHVYGTNLIKTNLPSSLVLILKIIMDSDGNKK